MTATDTTNSTDAKPQKPIHPDDIKSDDMASIRYMVDSWRDGRSIKDVPSSVRIIRALLDAIDVSVRTSRKHAARARTLEIFVNAHIERVREWPTEIEARTRAEERRLKLESESGTAAPEAKTKPRGVVPPSS